jgi:hypothetical protein
VELSNGDEVGKALLFGDLRYPTVERIFDKTKEKTARSGWSGIFF